MSGPLGGQENHETTPLPDAGSLAAAAEEAETWRVKEQLLLAMLPHVAFEGWSPAALRAGCADAGLALEEGALLFAGGAREIIPYWSEWSDRQMLQIIGQRPDFATLRLRDRVATAVRARIEVNAPWREAVRRTMSLMALPQYAGIGATCTWRTLDAIWYACGDTATDIGFYSKRATLGAVYATTVLYWLDDSSEDLRETWAFLDRRIEDLMRLPTLGTRVRDALGGMLWPLAPRRRSMPDR
jgi:ubiquinone biosynthesis protein COQ9